jgi:hypothetical protein
MDPNRPPRLQLKRCKLFFFAVDRLRHCRKNQIRGGLPASFVSKLSAAHSHPVLMCKICP